MRSVTVGEAKTQLSALLRAVEAGEEIEIRRGQQPVAKLVAAPRRRTIAEMRGAWAGQVEIPDPSIWEPDPQDAIDFGIVDPDEVDAT
jgi:antitoxin (DNA-binding transcriptional repressor) of toxin-antitoxin stability system